MDDGFDTQIPPRALAALLELGSQLGFDPTASPEAGEFFAQVVAEYCGTDEGIQDWLGRKLSPLFKCVDVRPQWIQNPSWPFTSHGPMTFVGQIDIPPGLFHDASSFYTFYEPESGLIKTILQVA
jgi:hypothetical protein